MLPVCGKPAIGTAFALNFTVGTAEATPGSARASALAAVTARPMIALRIPVLLPLLRVGGQAPLHSCLLPASTLPAAVRCAHKVSAPEHRATVGSAARAGRLVFDRDGLLAQPA